MPFSCLVLLPVCLLYFPSLSSSLALNVCGHCFLYLWVYDAWTVRDSLCVYICLDGPAPSHCLWNMIYICTPGSWHVLFGAPEVCVCRKYGFPICVYLCAPVSVYTLMVWRFWVCSRIFPSVSVFVSACSLGCFHFSMVWYLVVQALLPPPKNVILRV